MGKDRNASASAFGWQFQINVAIYLMCKYFKDFEEIKLEGDKEDIEILLENKKKIYAQAKSKQKIDISNTKGYSTKLKEALDSLSDVNNEDIDKLIYISNLEPNPLNSKTKEFELVTFLKYEELLKESKEKIDIQLEKTKNTIDKTKLIIAKIPFYGEDEANKKKYITQQLEKFLACVNGELLPYSKILLNMWESEFINNATQRNTLLKIKKNDILWNLIVCALDKKNISVFDPEIEPNEEDYQLALDKYEKVIMHKEGNFNIYSRISVLYRNQKKFKPDIRIIEFIDSNITEIYDIVFCDTKNEEEELIEIICSKIIAKRIALRNNFINQMIGRAKVYED